MENPAGVVVKRSAVVFKATTRASLSGAPVASLCRMERMWMELEKNRAPTRGEMKTRALSPKNNAEDQLAGCIDKFTPEMAKAIRAAQAALRKRLPTANELVYDNYNFFVIGYSSTLRPSDCFTQLVADAHGVRLAFYYGSTLTDPAGILLGGGNQNRFIQLANVRDLRKPEVDALIGAAIAQGKAPLPATGRGTLVIRAVSAKQRPRRVAAGPARSR
jgi:hypothetical protein